MIALGIAGSPTDPTAALIVLPFIVVGFVWALVVTWRDRRRP